MSKFHSLKIKDIRKETDDAVSLAFEIPENLHDIFQYIPGQYLTLRAQVDGEDIRRAYSICSVMGDDLRVGIKRIEDGRFSSFAHNLQVGDEVQVMPPQGQFICANEGDGKNILLIAAGSGITPMLSIASHILEEQNDSRVTLIYGNQTTASIMFRTALEELKDRYLERFHMHHMLSREVQDVELFSGRIDVERLKRMVEKGLLDPQQYDAIYICGPQEMSETVSAYFGEVGIDKSKIFVELFEAADGGKPVKISKSVKETVKQGVEIEVIFDGLRKQINLVNTEHTVLDAAQASGLDLPFSCAGGMCATCRCKIIEGEAEMDKNYSLADWELADGYVLCCQLRPKSSKLVIDFDAA